MDAEIRTYKRLPDGSFELLQHKHTLSGYSLDSLRRMARATVEALPEVDLAEVVNIYSDEVTFVWPQETPNA